MNIFHLSFTNFHSREKSSTGSPAGESGFTPEDAMRKTAGLSHKTEANS